MTHVAVGSEGDGRTGGAEAPIAEEYPQAEEATWQGLHACKAIRGGDDDPRNAPPARRRGTTRALVVLILVVCACNGCNGRRRRVRPGSKCGREGGHTW